MSNNNLKQDYSLKIIKNRLLKKGPIPMIEVTNDYCNVRIYYDGNYEQDFNNDKMDPKLLNVVLKTKKSNFDIEVNPLRIATGMFIADMESRSEADALIADLENIKQTTIELQDIFKTYFKIEYNF